MICNRIFFSRPYLTWVDLDHCVKLRARRPQTRPVRIRCRIRCCSHFRGLLATCLHTSDPCVSKLLTSSTHECNWRLRQICLLSGRRRRSSAASCSRRAASTFRESGRPGPGQPQKSLPGPADDHGLVGGGVFKWFVGGWRGGGEEEGLSKGRADIVGCSPGVCCWTTSSRLTGSL